MASMTAGLHSSSVVAVGFATDPQSAEARATALLGSGSARLRHVAGVATTAARLRGVSASDAELLVSAAWLHDVGYAQDVVQTGFHPLDGARYLRSSGAPDRLCRLVANHTGAWVEAESRSLAAVLAAEFPAEDSAIADALTFADLTTRPDGGRVEVEDRIEEVLHRYEPGHVVHESIRRAAPDLIATVRRIEARLAALQPK